AFEPRLAVRRAQPDFPLVWFGVFEGREEVAPPQLVEGASQVGELLPSVTEAEHAAAVGRILALIRAGDTYQVNHPFRLRGRFQGSDAALDARLCAGQRAEYCAYMRLPRHTIVAASPELFLRRSGDALEVRPMKGTR